MVILLKHSHLNSESLNGRGTKQSLPLQHKRRNIMSFLGPASAIKLSREYHKKQRKDKSKSSIFCFPSGKATLKIANKRPIKRDFYTDKMAYIWSSTFNSSQLI